MSDGWKYAGASVIGTSHLKSAEGVCQDSHLCFYSPELDCIIGVVSDGAGSASHSEVGSRIACSCVLANARVGKAEEIYSREFALGTIDLIRESITQEAEQRQLRIREFACTLLVAIVGAERATFWQIGDGAICFRLKEDEEFNFAFWPAKGEYANGTYFVTDPDFQSEVEFDSWTGRIADLALFSDGLERLALDFKAGRAYSNFFRGFFSHLYEEDPGRLFDLEKKLAEFLSSERVNEKTDDDKTLILATVENR